MRFENEIQCIAFNRFAQSDLISENHLLLYKGESFNFEICYRIIGNSYMIHTLYMAIKG